MTLTDAQINALLAESDPAWLGVMARLLPRILVAPNGCWIFTGALSPAGYGVIGRGRRGQGNVMTHRATYAALVGPLLPDMEIDHLCKMEPCCLPRHLEQVTPQVNKNRSWNSAAMRAKYAAQTHCKHGHEFSPENTYYGTRGGYVTRQCRTCTSRPARQARREARA